MNNKLLEKLSKNSTVTESCILDESQFFEEKEIISTPVPVFNVALSGDLNGGFSEGIITLAGASRSFKTNFALLMVKSYLDKYPDATVLFYDSEFGAPKSYFNAFKIDTKRVLHTPIQTIEELKIDLVNQLNGIQRGDKVIILVDSIGMLPSEKEAENAQEGKTTADLTRNRELKSFFRLATTKLAMKKLSMVVISHSYKTLELYSRDVISIGTGGYFASNIMIIVSRSQEKDNSELVGYNFAMTIEKSRFVKEKSKIPITVHFNTGISKYSGLLDIALDSGHVIKPSNGWYSRVNIETGEIEEKKWRIKDTNTSKFWNDILQAASFKQYIIDTYQYQTGSIVNDVSDELISANIDE